MVSPYDPRDYTGTKQFYVPTAAYPPKNRDPTTQDLKNPFNGGYYKISTVWVNQTTDIPWMLVDVDGNVATWVPLLGGDLVLIELQTKLSEDFLTQGSSGLNIDVSGAATVATGQAAPDRSGVWQFSTGASPTGSSSCSFTGIYAGDGVMRFKTAIKLEDLSTISEEFTVSSGYGNYPSEGAFLVYDRLVHGANWQFITTDSGGSTVIDTGVAVVADTWLDFQLIFNAAGTQVEALIEGVSVGVSSTNISSAAFTTGNYIIKSAGTTARVMYCDYVVFEKQYTTPR